MAKTTRKKVINILDDLRQPLADARAYERGEEVDLRVMEIAPPPRPMKPSEIRKARESDGVRAFSLRKSKSSSGFEQAIRRPRSTALRLLAIAESIPNSCWQLRAHARSEGLMRAIL